MAALQRGDIDNPRDVSKQRTFDVTDALVQVFLILACPCTCFAIMPGVLGKKMLILEEEEAVLTSDCCMGCHEVKRMPYGELGNVHEIHVCCCVSFSSNLSQGIRGAEGGSKLMPGNCCEQALVSEIVQELKTRMKKRGDTGQIQRAEENAHQLRHLHAKMDAVMTHLNIPPVAAPMKMEDR